MHLLKLKLSISSPPTLEFSGQTGLGEIDVCSQPDDGKVYQAAFVHCLLDYRDTF